MPGSFLGYPLATQGIHVGLARLSTQKESVPGVRRTCSTLVPANNGVVVVVAMMDVRSSSCVSVAEARRRSSWLRRRGGGRHMLRLRRTSRGIRGERRTCCRVSISHRIGPGGSDMMAITGCQIQRTASSASAPSTPSHPPCAPVSTSSSSRTRLPAVRVFEKRKNVNKIIFPMS